MYQLFNTIKKLIKNKFKVWQFVLLGLIIMGTSAFKAPFLPTALESFLINKYEHSSFLETYPFPNQYQKLEISPKNFVSKLQFQKVFRPMRTLCLPDDSLALVELYNATDGANWTNPWVLTDPWNTWNGVVLGNNDSCVLELNLSNQNLVGTIPAGFFGGDKLNQVERIDLSQNELTDEIPAAFGDLLTLEELNLSNNNFTGEVPADLSNLLVLERLDLSFNSLTGNFPASLTDIATLLELDFISIDSNFIENVPIFPVNRPIEINIANNRLKLNSLVENNKSQYTFTYSPQDSIGEFKIVNVPEGSVWRDTVSANQVNGTTTYRWLRGADLISEQNDDSVLVINEANEPDHEGIYTVEVTHSAVPDITLYRKKFFVNVLTCPSNNEITIPDTTVCDNVPLPTITATDAELGDIPFFSYKWQEALDGDTTNWADAAVGNVRDYSLSNAGVTIGDTAYFRRIVVPAPDTGCSEDTTEKVLVTLLPNITTNELFPPTQNVCLGEFPINIYGTTSDSSETSIFRYRYQVSLDSGMTWIDSLQTQNFDFTDSITALDTVQFRRIVTGACLPDTSNTVTLFAIPPVVADSIFESQTICIDTRPDTVRGDMPTGGDGEYMIFWQTATRLDTADWVNTDSLFNRFIPPIANDTFYIRRIVRSACFADTSNIIDIFISPDLGNDTSAISIPRTKICQGDSLPNITGTAPTFPSGYRYLWEVSLDSVAWTGVDTLQNYNPVDSLLFDSIFASVPDSFLVRRLVIDSCKSYFSNVLRVFMVKPIDSVSNLIFYDSTGVCVGDSTWQIEAAQPTGGSGNYTYQWQISFDSIAWADRDDSLNIATYVLNDPTYFRRLVRDSCRTDTSNVVFIDVSKPFGVNQISTPQLDVCVGDSTTIALTGTDPEEDPERYEFIYQQSRDTLAWFSSSTFTFSTGNFTQSQTFVPDTLFGGANYFRRIILGGCEPDTSNRLLVNIVLNARNNFLFGNQTICQGDTVMPITFTDPIAGEAGNLEIEWEFSSDSVNWIPSLISDTVDFVQPEDVQETTYVRRGVRSGDCPPDYSNVVTIKVIRFIENNIISSTQDVVCEGSAADTLRGTFPREGGNDSTAYRFIWQSRRMNDSTALWRNVGGLQDYFTGAINFDTEYRRIVRVNCFDDTSNVVQITIKPRVRNNIIDEGFVDCALDTLGQLRGTVLLDTLNEFGQFRYQWQFSRNRTDWTDVPNTNLPNYQPTPVDTTTFYRRLVITECFRDSSNIATITIRPVPVLEMIQDTTINIGYDVQLFANGAINYVWTPAETLDNDSIANPIATPRISTLYVVRAENVSGCVTLDSVFITVIGTPRVRTVDVITPDGNGLNDELFIEEIERYPDNELVIINRWGQEVFRKKGYANDWQGTNKTGGVLPAGTYFYILKFDSIQTILKGSFEIIR